MAQSDATTAEKLRAIARACVEGLRSLAFAAGGTCDGAPGQRMPTFYGAYFRDLDGNKLVAFVMG